MIDDPRADYRDADDVLHRWDPDLAAWYHPAGSRCRDESCPDNRGALERLGGVPPGSTEADASAARRAIQPASELDLTGITVTIDLTTVDLRYASGGIATVILPLLEADASDPTDAPRLHLDSRRDSPYPIFMTGEPVPEFTRDEALELAVALLALVREHDARLASGRTDA